MKLRYIVSDDTKTTSFLYDEVCPMIASNSDFWRVHLDNGKNREIEVCSSQQCGTVVKKVDETVVSYDRLIGEDNVTYHISLEVHIVQKGNGLEFYSVIQNNDTVRVNEMQLPFLQLEKIHSETDKEVLYLPIGLGMKRSNPRNFIKNSCHTEYMAADYKNIWYMNLYPSPLTMSWMGVQSGDYYLYMSRLDEDAKICTFLAGTLPRNKGNDLILSVSQYPMAVNGETITTPQTYVELFRGDWRCGTKQYRAWADSTWNKTRREIPEWVKSMTGWQRIILKHQYGEIFFKYKDLPNIYLDGAKYGIHTLLVFGWWKGGMDNDYPNYEADEDLGGGEALRKAIAEVQRLGGRVLLYSNGKLIDVKTDYYREIGKDICQTDIDLNEFREHYQFSNNGSVLRNNGYKSFVAACQATNEWKSRLLETTKAKLSFHPDSVFFDQIGGCQTRLCFNESHKHKNRPDVEAVFRRENMDAVKELLEKDQSIGSENVVDCYANMFDYIHGCCPGCWPEYGQVPAIFRSTFPEVIISNRLMHDDKGSYRHDLNNAFTYGLIFDSSVYRCRKASMSAEPESANYTKELIDKKEQYHKFFYDGKFVCDTDLTLPSGIAYSEYLSPDGERLFVLWNDNNSEIKVSLFEKEYSFDPQSVNCIVK